MSTPFRAAIPGVLAALVASLPAGLAAEPPRAIPLEQRIAAERAVQDVYAAARSWPEANPSAKPSRNAALTDEALRARVIDLLRKSEALSARWGRAPSAAVLAAELRRMAAGTRAPETLRALFAALGDDPVLEAETLARRAVVERELRFAYAWDRELHAMVRARAEAAMRGVLLPSDLARSGGLYRETVVRLDGPADPDELAGVARGLQSSFGRQPDATSENAATALHGLPVGRVSTLGEDADGFRAVAVLDAGRESIRIATATWAKIPFDSWWRGASSAFSPAVPPLDGPIAAVTPSADHSCVSGPPWTPTPTWGVPSPRYLHTAVWTGAEMIVWGGQTDAQSLGTGFRYDPAIDTWTPVATLAAPKDREAHTAVWTGSKMIVWGGTTTVPLADGGVYDPVLDQWQPTSLTNAPTPRSYHSAVWTGSRMIVWGGQGGSGTGASYDPVTESWTPITATGAPSDRSRHVAAWTGSRMVVWGGRSPAGAALDTGGVYNPSGDAWTPTAMTGAPSARWDHSGSWSGIELWVWGGTPDGSTVLGDGARYDAEGDSWAAMSGADSPSARTDHRATWAGTQLIVWGGSNGSSPLSDGGRYDASTESWLPVASSGAPAARRLHTAVWTGSRMLVFGGLDARAARTDGARYDPVGDVWSSMTGGVWAPSTRRSSVSVSTGAEFIVYGGETFDTSGPEWTATGAVYDPATDAWRSMTPPDPMQVLPCETTAVWTGSAMIVWGGRDPSGAEAVVDTGGRYDPALDAWTPVATPGAPGPRSLHTAVWTGTEMIVWGGVGAAILDSGGRYDPVANTWAPIASGGTARYWHTAVWTGSRMIAWGGQGVAAGGLGGPAAIYDLAANTWSSSGSPLPGNDQPPIARINHTAVWTGSRMIVWGGQKPTSMVVKYRDGASYDPALDRWFSTNLSGAPTVRDKHVAVWDGSRMVVWGGTNSCCFLADGAEYDLGTNAWTPTYVSGAPAARGQHVGGLLGTAAIVWGGMGLGSRSLNSGATYCTCSFYADVDGDGYGNPLSLLRDCSFVTPPPGYVRDAGDCNDAAASVNPGATDDNCDGIDQNCSGTADDGFVGEASSCGVAECAATGTTSCVAGAIVDTCTPGPASPEICDGIDNDCDGFVDNVPLGAAELTAEKSGAAVQLTWSALFSAASYDVTRGLLGTLREGNGDFTPSVDACVANEQAATTAADSTPAPPDDGFWYLVRGNNCAGAGSYDEGVVSQSGSRDAEVDASALACP